MTFSRIGILVAMIAMLAGCATPPPMPTVATVDLDRYLGTWYEVALIPNRFQEQCASDTRAEYTRDGDAIRVTNRCRTSDGKEEVANGIARVVADSGNARLRVSFFRPFYGDYWILALDPGYRWVLVGEPQRKYGWILARTPSLDPAIVKTLLDRAADLGYDRNQFRSSLQTPLPDTPVQPRCGNDRREPSNC